MPNYTFTWKYGDAELWGSFNGWSSGICLNEGQATLDLEPGVYQYKFKNGDNWMYDIELPHMDDMRGGRNNIVRIKDDYSGLDIVHISDTHSLHNDLNIPEGDVLVVSGDFTIAGHPGEYDYFNDWLGRIPIPYKIVTLGNHDIEHMMNVENIDPIKHAQNRLSNAKILSCESFIINKFKFYGIQWHWFHDWKHTNIADGVELWDTTPEDTDVLITHSPPLGMCDEYYGTNTGSFKLSSVVSKIMPKCHLFGHIHETYKTRTIKWRRSDRMTIFSNASNVQPDGLKIVNPARVISIYK